MKILMVCLGNICRSPLAEGLLQHKIDNQKIDAFVDSAGTSSYHIGEPADLRMCETAKKNGINIDHLRARQFNQGDFETFDLIYVMDQSNYENVLALNPTTEQQKKVHLILNESHPGKNLFVPDPYFGDQDGFDEVFMLLDEATNAIIEKRIKNAKR